LNTTTTAPGDVPDPLGDPQAGGSPVFGPAHVPVVRVVYWSARRELWENRWLYIAPLIVAAVALFGFSIGIIRAPLAGTAGSAPAVQRALAGACNFASGVLMLTYLVVAVIYCLEALHGERRDRSILFWKSLPVSDLATVIAKACLPLLILPLITFAIVVVTQGIMLLIGSAVLLGRGASPAPLWAALSLPQMWLALLYHLMSVHALYYAPIYGWLLLVSGWARRATFLWAILPIIAVLIIERLVFDTSAFAHMLLSRLAGGPAAIPFPLRHDMPIQAPTLGDIGAFLASPGLWIGLAIFAVFLAAAVRLRRYQGPI
jgi:ABC-2 type transport system permease protein